MLIGEEVVEDGRSVRGSHAEFAADVRRALEGRRDAEAVNGLMTHIDINGDTGALQWGLLRAVGSRCESNDYLWLHLTRAQDVGACRPAQDVLHHELTLIYL